MIHWPPSTVCRPARAAQTAAKCHLYSLQPSPTQWICALNNNKQRWIMVWQQIYDPFGNPVISTLMAAVPVVVMLAALAFFHVKAHLAALLALASALLISILPSACRQAWLALRRCLARRMACCQSVGSSSTSSFSIA